MYRCWYYEYSYVARCLQYDWSYTGNKPIKFGVGFFHTLDTALYDNLFGESSIQHMAPWLGIRITDALMFSTLYSSKIGSNASKFNTVHCLKLFWWDASMLWLRPSLWFSSSSIVHVVIYSISLCWGRQSLGQFLPLASALEFFTDALTLRLSNVLSGRLYQSTHRARPTVGRSHSQDRSEEQ